MSGRVTRALEPNKKRGFCSALAAFAAGVHPCALGWHSMGSSCFGVMRSAIRIDRTDMLRGCIFGKCRRPEWRSMNFGGRVRGTMRVS